MIGKIKSKFTRVIKSCPNNKKSSYFYVLFIGIASLSITACSRSDTSQSTSQVLTEPRWLACKIDTDCGENSQCNLGRCVVSQNSTNPALDALLTPPIADCKDNDNKIPIPVWEPKVNEFLTVSTAPPQQENQIVYIQLNSNVNNIVCNNSALNFFNFFNEKDNPKYGGKAINIRGNTYKIDNQCYFVGFYKNESVPSIYPEWQETYYGEIEQTPDQLVPNYCMARKLQ